MNAHDRIAPPRIDPARTPFTATAAFRRYGVTDDPDQSSPEALYTKAAIQEQGFDGPPHVVSQRELNTYAAAGEVELYRGVTDRRFAEQLRIGDFFVGRGGILDRLFAAAGRDALPVAREYAARGDGTIIRMTLKREARIIDAPELEATARSDYQSVDRRAELVWLLYTQLGAYAAYLGYDAVHIVDFPDTDYYVVLNRTALRVQRENRR
jgi:hypothetical protein